MVTKIKRTIVVQGDSNKQHLGLVHIYTGDGKGKTTTALGLALRAQGNGLKVYMIQFLKCCDTGELFSVQKYLPNMKIVQYGVEALSESQSRLYEFGQEQPKEEHKKEEFHFMPDEQEREAARQAFEHAKKIIHSGEYDLVILDEINCAMDKGLLPIQEVLQLMEDHGHVELVFTGMDAPKEIMERADYVSYIQKLKHPWMKGIVARKGIEY